MVKKRNMYLVSTKDLLLGVDFAVLTNTDYVEEEVDYFYKIVNHTINERLIHLLGLGIVYNLHEEDDFYIYNATDLVYDMFSVKKEVTRIAVYYQLTHPYYEDDQLKQFMLTERGKKYLYHLVPEAGEELYNHLLQIFSRDNDNVVLFPFES